jgi:putative transcription antitermination factor YqgF
MSLLALDYGEKRIGIAITDEYKKIVTSLPYIANKSETKLIRNKDYPKNTSPEIIRKDRKDAKLESKIELRKVFNKLLHYINTYYPEKIIIGMPMSFDAKENIYKYGPQAKKVKNFAKKLELFLKKHNIICEIEFIEESMSSKIAKENLSEIYKTEGKIKDKIDSESARIMLVEYLARK